MRLIFNTDWRSAGKFESGLFIMTNIHNKESVK